MSDKMHRLAGMPCDKTSIMHSKVDHDPRESLSGGKFVRDTGRESGRDVRKTMKEAGRGLD